ncbi:NlpC/P60 family protein, partial [Frankia sp. AgKG'84/4]|nr:NlpC/P60 family protein [Frankia sp. AgKG'84/4]
MRLPAPPARYRPQGAGGPRGRTTRLTGPVAAALAGLLLAGSAALAVPAGVAWGAPSSTSSSLDAVRADIERTRAALDESTRQTARAAEEFDAGRIRLAAAQR